MVKLAKCLQNFGCKPSLAPGFNWFGRTLLTYLQIKLFPVCRRHSCYLPRLSIKILPELLIINLYLWLYNFSVFVSFFFSPSSWIIHNQKRNENLRREVFSQGENSCWGVQRRNIPIPWQWLFCLASQVEVTPYRSWKHQVDQSQSGLLVVALSSSPASPRSDSTFFLFNSPSPLQFVFHLILQLQIFFLWVFYFILLESLTNSIFLFLFTQPHKRLVVFYLKSSYHVVLMFIKWMSCRSLNKRLQSKKWTRLALIADPPHHPSVEPRRCHRHQNYAV